MKKLVFAATAVAACIAMGTDVSSSVVGYSTRAMGTQQFRLLGIPFETTSSTYYLNDIMPYTSTIAVDWSASAAQRLVEAAAYAPQVQIQKPDGGYETYYYVTNARYRDSNNQAAYKPGWCTQTGAYADSANGGIYPGLLTPGVAVWFKDFNNETPTITTAGKVITGDVSITCPAQFRLRAPAFPIEFGINDAEQVTYTGIDSSIAINWSAPAAQRLEDAAANAPQIQIQKADGGYETYYYVSNARYRDSNNQAAYKAGWCTQTGALADAANGGIYPGKVPVNGAFWAKGVGSEFTMTFLAP